MSERPTPRRSPRFPARTLLLMIVALAALVRFWWLTQRTPVPPGPEPAATPVEVTPLGPGR